MFENIKQITYRGSLKSCNYTCFYCPFNKNKMAKVETEKDSENLEKFIKWLDKVDLNEKLEVFFAPYGETLIHEYYIKALGELTKKNNIFKVGCQTNLSFDLESLLEVDANFDKIYLWATFHPTMVEVDDFVSRVFELAKHINISVGVVGNPEEIVLIRELRKKLPINVYMWINAMEGLDRTYTPEEIESFRELDPMFTFELGRVGDSECNCGESHIFVNSNGRVFGCNRNRNNLGNIYEDLELKKIKCSGRSCDCYLAYSHTRAFRLSRFIGENNLFRVPYKIKPKAVFFDVDGTLTEDKDVLVRTFEYISTKVPIYLATELPEDIALKKIGSLKKYISGGVFSGGSLIVDYKSKFKHVEPLVVNDFEFLEKVVLDVRNTIYTDENKIYRITTHKKFIGGFEELGLEIIKQNKSMYSVVSKGVDKLFGINILIKALDVSLNEVMCVGNEVNDLSMLVNCGYAVGVLDSCKEVNAVADYILKVSHIATLI